MKVLHLISGGDTGGAKTHIMSLFNGLNKLIDGKIICFIEDSFYYEAKEAGIDIEVYEQKGRADMTVVKRLISEINDQDYDMVHCHGARANFIAMFLKGKVKKPFITTVHSDYKLDFKDNFYKKIIFTTLNSFALRRFDYFIAVSDSFKEMLVQRHFKKDKIFVVYNGIIMDQKLEYKTREEFLSEHNINGEGKTIVGIIARLDKVKDHETFIKAAKIALEKNKDLEFLIAGDGGEREKIQTLTEVMGIADKIHMLGYLTDVYSFLNAIDINTLTSLSESFPYAVLEGAIMKKTIISTKVGGLTKLIEDDVNGYLVNVGDYQDLGGKIFDLSMDKEKIIEMGEKLYEKVKENYSSDEMARQHVEIYEKVVSKRKGESK